MFESLYSVCFDNVRDGAIRLSCLNEDASYQELAFLYCELCYGGKPYIKCSATLNADFNGLREM
jgi:hypothetical protein